MSGRCILFADIVGSEVIRDKLGDGEARRASERALKRAQMALEQGGGRLLKEVADGLFAEFADAGAALAAACEMQHRVADLPPLAGQQMSLRIGFHSSEAIADAELPAELAAQAQPGQILASAAAVAGLPALARQSLRTLPALKLAGRDEPLAVCDVVWQAQGAATVAAEPDAAPAEQVDERGALLTLHYENVVREMDRFAGALVIGREKDCGLTVHDPRASRHHARVEHKGDGFVLIDQSTNGTWVARDGQEELRVHREELPLVGRGRISLGHPAAEGEACITFWLS